MRIKSLRAVISKDIKTIHDFFDLPKDYITPPLESIQKFTNGNFFTFLPEIKFYKNEFYTGTAFAEEKS